MITLTIVLVFIVIALIFAIPLNIKRFFNKKQNKKWAFFHPFWYAYNEIVTMEEVERRSYGA